MLSGRGNSVRPVIVLAVVALMAATMACGGGKKSGTGDASDTIASHALPDTLIVGTLYSPTAFFILRDDTLGYDYERICDFARDHGIGLRFKVAESMKELMGFLEKGEVDLLAVEIPEIAEYKSVVIPCGSPNVTYQVLVQPNTKDVITDVTQLVGHDVYVIQGSQYEARLRNLDSEIGGGINIHPIDNDTIIDEDLIDMVATGKLPMTVVNSDIAQLNATYYGDDKIDISLRVSFAQRSSWAVGKNDAWLADTINAWAASDRAKAFSLEAKRRYFELSKSNGDSADYQLKDGDISPYDSLFRVYAPTARVDWLMLAAICKVESGFNNHLISWAGARGIMQVMPSTAKAYGFTADDLDDPEKCIDVASQSLADLEEFLKPRITDEAERMHFKIASYNSGVGHIVDAIALAKKYDLDPNVWYENVEEAALWKSRPEYYNDPVCRYGYFRAKETVNYVKQVEQAYDDFVALAKPKNTKPKSRHHKSRRHKR